MTGHLPAFTLDLRLKDVETHRVIIIRIGPRRTGSGGRLRVFRRKGRQSFENVVLQEKQSGRAFDFEKGVLRFSLRSAGKRPLAAIGVGFLV